MSKKQSPHFNNKKNNIISSSFDNTEITLEELNKRTKVFNDQSSGRIIYVFDYDNFFNNNTTKHHQLKDLKDKHKWELIRHPLILNYINETLLNCAWIYAFQLIFYFAFLFLLCFYIHSEPTVWLNIVLIGFIIILAFLLTMKIHMRVEREKNNNENRRGIYLFLKNNLRFILYAIFTSLTYLIIFFFAWFSLANHYDSSNPKLLKSVVWFLPIIAVLFSWVHCLHILRKSPCGIYIMMMARILRSFINLALIWIITLICFTFSFRLVMKGSQTHPWNYLTNSTSTNLSIFKTFTKITAMMVGEIEVNDIIEQKEWIASVLLITFEIITVILLMNLMISLSVGDVSQLRASAEKELLRVKTSFCINALFMPRFFSCWCCGTPLNKKRINNILVINKNDDSEFSTYSSLSDYLLFQNDEPHNDENIYEFPLNSEGLKFFAPIICNTENELRTNFATNKKTLLRIVKATDEYGIGTVNNVKFLEILKTMKDEESFVIKFKRWLIGLKLRNFPVKNVGDIDLFSLKIRYE